MVSRYRVDLAGILRLMNNNISKNKRKLAGKQTAVALQNIAEARRNEISVIVLRRLRDGIN